MSIPRALLVLALTTTACIGTNTTRPNVLVLVADDLGWNGVGFHDKNAPTPNLNRLAQEGTELQRFYVYPLCSPTRAAFITGQMPRRFGITKALGPPDPGMPAGMPTLPSAFRAAGYQTSLIGKWHLGAASPPLKSGFDHFYGFMGSEIDYFTHTGKGGGRIDWQRDGAMLREEGYSSYLLADEAVRQLKQRDAARPFYMQVTFNAPHETLSAPQELTDHFKDYAKTMQLYAAVIEGLDIGIGRILSALDELELRDVTLVVFFSDNGAPCRVTSNAPLNAGKESVYEGGIRTPAIIRWPSHVRTGAKSQQPVCVQDLFPTLASAAGVPMPRDAKIDGLNQWPALSENKRVEREPFLIATGDIAMIDGDWKLIEWGNGQRALYNLQSDISEAHDLITSDAERAKQMGEKLDELKKDLPSATAARRGPPGRGRPGGGKGPPR